MLESELEPTLEAELEMLGADEIDTYSEEERQVLLWRIDQFCRLGFGYVDAIVLADTKVDLSGARRLIGRGCPIRVATKILL